MGILLSDIRHDYVRTYKARLSTADVEKLGGLYGQMERKAKQTLDRESV